MTAKPIGRSAVEPIQSYADDAGERVAGGSAAGRRLPERPAVADGNPTHDLRARDRERRRRDGQETRLGVCSRSSANAARSGRSGSMRSASTLPSAVPTPNAVADQRPRADAAERLLRDHRA